MLKLLVNPVIWNGPGQINEARLYFSILSINIILVSLNFSKKLSVALTEQSVIDLSESAKYTKTNIFSLPFFYQSKEVSFWKSSTTTWIPTYPSDLTASLKSPLPSELPTALSNGTKRLTSGIHSDTIDGGSVGGSGGSGGGSTALPNSSLRIFTAKYSYDPYQYSPNDNPALELSLKSGEYLIVHGDMDADGFYHGELMDGRRGLVPSNFVAPVDSKCYGQGEKRWDRIWERRQQTKQC